MDAAGNIKTLSWTIQSLAVLRGRANRFRFSVHSQ